MAARDSTRPRLTTVNSLAPRSLQQTDNQQPTPLFTPFRTTAAAMSDDESDSGETVSTTRTS
jgi:hypothetical protein